jgi:8-oxo-dGTP pyrophosphatase MutT (NUDIX family)
MKQTTLCLLFKENKILLAMKKRGFGMGRWNGTGGKFDEEKGDKNILEAAVRETKEEIGVEIKNPEKFGEFCFRFPDKPEWDQNVHLFVAKDWQGEITESEEMMPKWFSFDEIPYKNMWPDDILWMPHVLQGKKVKASFSFGEGDTVLDHKLEIVEQV